MRWIYILKCEDNTPQEDCDPISPWCYKYYVGQTSRLYRRLSEHSVGNGGSNTFIYNPKEIVALYKVDTLGKFLDYNEKFEFKNNISRGMVGHKLKTFDDKMEEDYQFNCSETEMENFITECMMINWKKCYRSDIRGGKYTRFDIDYVYPNPDNLSQYNLRLKDLPICKCKLPCDIKCKKPTINNNFGHLYFRCPKKNLNWIDWEGGIDVNNSPCNFYKEYIKDIKIRQEMNERPKKLSELLKKSSWLKNIPDWNNEHFSSDSNKGTYCVGKSVSDSLDWDDKTDKECCSYRSFNMISYCGIKKALCFDCFIDNNLELSKKYDNCPCLIDSDED